MISDLSWMPFKNISLDDPFFGSLKDDYPGFDVWFKKKSLNGAKALVLVEEERIHAFLALKDENEEIVLTGKILPAIARLKISTLKIDEKVGGQRLGEGLIGVALWHWQKIGAEEIYVTIFEKQEKLIGLLKRFGFVCQGYKVNGELVFLKSRKNLDYSDAYKAFPFLSPNAPKAGIIPIKDGFHDRLFPYSESYYASEIEGTTAGNGITKVYIGTPYTATHYTEGEIVGIYRIYDGANKGSRSAITSFCTITKITFVKRNGRCLMTLDEYLANAGNKTVFSKDELSGIYRSSNVVMIEMVYNGFFDKGHNITYWQLKNKGLFESHPYNIDYSMNEMIEILKLGGKDVGNIIIDKT